MTTPSRLLIPLRWAWRHKFITGVGLLGLAFVGLNISAFLHARAMTHFTAGGTRTAKPEALSIGDKFRALLLGVTIPRPENAVDARRRGARVRNADDRRGRRHRAGRWHVIRRATPRRGGDVPFVCLVKGSGCESTSVSRDGLRLLPGRFPRQRRLQRQRNTVGVREADDVIAAVSTRARAGTRQTLHPLWPIDGQRRYLACRRRAG